MMRISKSTPRPPLGPYPQERLCGHAGNAPRINRIATIIKMLIT